VKSRWPLLLLGAAVAVGLANLGLWQLGRATAKQAQLDAAAAALAGAPQDLAAATARGEGSVAKVAGRGAFLALPPLLLDNQRRDAAVGLRVYCAFQPDAGAPLLVDLGWLPLGANRALPAVACPQGEQAVAGLLVPPPAVGLRLGPGLERQADGAAWLATRVEPAQVSAAWQLQPPLSEKVLRLDPALPLGYPRDLALLANTLPPEKHRGYALQWFGLSAATVVILLVLSLRRRP
jgi:cytochrome oxidase assembly protein ShyY1